MTGTVLVLGASGRFGRHTAEAFWNAGWRVRVFDRNADDLLKSAEGVDVIVNGWNPPYPQWRRDVPAFTEEVIKAAKKSGATVIIPGNIYVYGQGLPYVVTDRTPKLATNPLGRIRIEMEAAYRDAGVKTIVLRAGDFLDTEATGNWFDLVITSKLAKGIVTAPGDPEAPHAWAFLPDLARAAVDLAEKRDMLERYCEVLFPGITLNLREMTGLIAAATGREVTLKRMSWLPLWLAAPFWPMAPNLIEMRYLWSTPHRLDGSGLDRLLPRFRATDPLSAIGAALGQPYVEPDQPMAGRAFDIAAE